MEEKRKEKREKKKQKQKQKECLLASDLLGADEENTDTGKPSCGGCSPTIQAECWVSE